MTTEYILQSEVARLAVEDLDNKLALTELYETILGYKMAKNICFFNMKRIFQYKYKNDVKLLLKKKMVDNKIT